MREYHKKTISNLCKTYNLFWSNYVHETNYCQREKKAEILLTFRNPRDNLWSGGTMKTVVTLLGALLLAALLLSTVSAQDGKQSHLMDGDAPWGLVIEFAPGTTLAQANDLRLKYDLQLAPQGYRVNDSVSFMYRHDDQASYDMFVGTYYHDNPCVKANNCPPITPINAYYEPVSNEVAAALLNEPIVGKLSNKNNAVFFWVFAIKEFVKLIFR